MTEIEYLKNIILPLVDNEENVKFEKKVDEQGILVNVTVPQSEISKLIGKHGNTVKAIRALCHVFGYRERQNIGIKINSER